MAKISNKNETRAERLEIGDGNGVSPDDLKGLKVEITNQGTKGSSESRW